MKGRNNRPGRRKRGHGIRVYIYALEFWLTAYRQGPSDRWKLLNDHRDTENTNQFVALVFTTLHNFLFLWHSCCEGVAWKIKECKGAVALDLHQLLAGRTLPRMAWFSTLMSASFKAYLKCKGSVRGAFAIAWIAESRGLFLSITVIYLDFFADLIYHHKH